MEDSLTKEIIDKLNAFIKQRGLRKTPQRDAIVSVIFSSDEHFTADELWSRMQKQNVDGSRATLYRTLSLLTEAGLLVEIDLGGDQTTYDPNYHDTPAHNHLICIDCGKIIEFQDDNIELLNNCITRRLGFRPHKQSIRLEAHCEKLRSHGVCDELIKARLQSKRLPQRR